MYCPSFQSVFKKWEYLFYCLHHKRRSSCWEGTCESRDWQLSSLHCQNVLLQGEPCYNYCKASLQFQQVGHRHWPDLLCSDRKPYVAKSVISLFKNKCTWRLQYLSMTLKQCLQIKQVHGNVLICAVTQGLHADNRRSKSWLCAQYCVEVQVQQSPPAVSPTSMFAIWFHIHVRHYTCSINQVKYWMQFSSLQNDWLTFVLCTVIEK